MADIFIKRVDLEFLQIALETYSCYIMIFFLNLFSSFLHILRFAIISKHCLSVAMGNLLILLIVSRNTIFEKRNACGVEQITWGIVLETSMKVQTSTMYSKQIVLVFNLQTSWKQGRKGNTDLCHRTRWCNFSYSSASSLFDYHSSVIDSWQCESYYNTQIGCMWFELWKTLFWTSYSNVLWSKRQTLWYHTVN